MVVDRPTPAGYDNYGNSWLNGSVWVTNPSTRSLLHIGPRHAWRTTRTYAPPAPA
jgi:hypothetical protein